MSVDISEEDRQMLLLALGQLAARRPGWTELHELASKFDNVVEGRAQAFDDFRRLHAEELETSVAASLSGAEAIIRAFTACGQALEGLGPEAQRRVARAIAAITSETP